MYLVRCGHFRSCDKDGGHTMRPAMAENPMLHGNFTSPYIEPELLPSEVLHHGNRDVCVFFSCDLEIDPMTFMYKLDPYLLKMYMQTKNELSVSRLSKVIILHTDRQTCRHKWLPLKLSPCHFAIDCGRYLKVGVTLA